MAGDSIRFLLPGSAKWEAYEDASGDDQENAGAAAARERLSSFLLISMQMQHLLVLAGSGTSYSVGGLSMEQLWTACVGDAPDASVSETLKTLGYGIGKEERNIEDLLSRCDAFQHLNASAEVGRFREAIVATILERCREPGSKTEHDLSAHKGFLRRLARRRARDTRLRLFTTNYDLCFETAAGALGLVALDGFSFSQPRRFDPRFFEYDIVHRGSGSSDVSSPSYVAGVFQYFKLHGSVDWECSQDGSTSVNPSVEASRACITYPATTKYQRSFQQPHLELMAQYLASLRQPNTCLVVVGFGFNDAHLTEPILSALESNPHFRLVIVARRAERMLAGSKNGSHWARLSEIVRRGADVGFFGGTFEQLVQVTPDLKALSPAEKLQGAIRDVSRPG